MAVLVYRTTSPVALVAATAKTVLTITAPTAAPCQIREISFMFDGATATNVPVLIDYYAIDPGGALGTAVGDHWTVDADPYRDQYHHVVSSDYSAEPNHNFTQRLWYLTPNGGVLILPLYGTDAISLSPGERKGFQLTAPNNVNVITTVSIWE